MSTYIVNTVREMAAWICMHIQSDFTIYVDINHDFIYQRLGQSAIIYQTKMIIFEILTKDRRYLTI